MYHDKIPRVWVGSGDRIGFNVIITQFMPMRQGSFASRNLNDETCTKTYKLVDKADVGSLSSVCVQLRLPQVSVLLTTCLGLGSIQHPNDRLWSYQHSGALQNNGESVVY